MTGAIGIDGTQSPLREKFGACRASTWPRGQNGLAPHCSAETSPVRTRDRSQARFRQRVSPTQLRRDPETSAKIRSSHIHKRRLRHRHPSSSTLRAAKRSTSSATKSRRCTSPCRSRAGSPERHAEWASRQVQRVPFPQWPAVGAAGEKGIQRRHGARSEVMELRDRVECTMTIRCATTRPSAAHPQGRPRDEKYVERATAAANGDERRRSNSKFPCGGTIFGEEKASGSSSVVDRGRGPPKSGRHPPRKSRARRA